MKAVILAGGLGTRISEETDRLPKPMVDIGGKPILWHIMKMYAHHGVKDFIICTGYRSYVIKEYFTNYYYHMSDLTVDLAQGEITVHQNNAEDWRITLVDTGLETMTGGRLKRVRKYLGKDEPFCFTYGDGVSDIDIQKLIAFHKKHGKQATVTSITPPGRFGVLDSKGNRVMGFAEKIDNTSRINGGFFVLEPSVIDLIKDDDTVWEKGPLETLAKKGHLMAYKHDGFWMAMDTLRDKRALEEMWESKKAPWKAW